MTQVFVNLPAPSANGSGAAVDVSTFGPLKTIVVAGGAVCVVTIEMSNEPSPTNWAPVAVFQNSGVKSIQIAAHWMRATVQQYKSGTPEVDVGGTNEGTSLVQLVAPVGFGTGAAVDTSVLGLFRTVHISGAFKGQCNIEVSEDGTSKWATVFSFQKGGQKSQTIAAKFMRVSRSGFPQLNLGQPTIYVGCTDSISGGGGSVSGGSGNVFVFRPGGVAVDNVFTDWATLVAEMATVQGVKILQFDDSISTPCIIPAGTWDMKNVEWTGFLKTTVPSANAISLGGAPSGGDVILPNLLSMGGAINPIVNLNTVSAPIVLPAQAITAMEIGEGFTGDFPQISNTGPAPFFDLSALGAGQVFLLRMQGSISGAAAAIQMGNSPGTFQISLYDSARIQAGMVAGTNAAALFNIFYFGVSGQIGRMSAFAGTFNFGRPDSFTGGAGWARFWMFPAAANQVNPAPSAVAFTTSTGLGMSTCLRFNTTAGDIAQTLPLIRAAAPAIGSFSTTPGVLESTGLMVIIKNETGANNVNVSPNGTTPDTIDGGAGAVAVPAGGSRMFISNGVSNWSVVGH